MSDRISKIDNIDSDASDGLVNTFTVVLLTKNARSSVRTVHLLLLPVNEDLDIIRLTISSGTLINSPKHR